MNEKLYAIYDVVARMVAGQIQMFRHDAAAVRFFGDVASRQDTIVGMHPWDFELICLGEIDEELTIQPERRTVISGKQWAAINEAPAGGEQPPALKQA